MKKNLFPVLITTLALVSCKDESSSSATGGYDTLKVSIEGFEMNDKNTLVNQYYKRFGIFIPRFYLTTNSLAIDLNGDGQIDTIGIFSPIVIEDEAYSDFQSRETPKRILVEILNRNGRSEVRNIYENLVSNIPGVLSKYNGISSTDAGFVVKHESGSRYSWALETEFGISQDSVTLIRLKKICSLEGMEEGITQALNLSARQFNVNDTIRANCNCDGLWKKLERHIDIE